MFSSLLGALKKATIGGEDGTEVNGDHDSENEQPTIDIPQIKTGITTSLPNKSSGEGENDENEIERIQSKGMITALDEDTGHGVIDRQYRVNVYQFADVQNEKFERGTTVEFTAVRTRKVPQWKVVSLKRHESDKEKLNKERARFKNVIAQVKTVCGEYVEIEAGNPKKKRDSMVIKIPYRREFDVGFSWMPGDWMQVRLENTGRDGDPEIDEDVFNLPECVTIGKILAIGPVQKKTVVGKVTRRNNNFLIDDSIYYTQEVCKSMLAVGAVVKCEAISSTILIGSCKQNDIVYWRAVNVQKSSFLHYTGAQESVDANGEGDWEIDEVGREAIARHQELMMDKCGVKITPRFLSFPPILIGTSAVKTFTIANYAKQVVCLRKFHVNQDRSVCQFEVKCAKEEPDGTVIIIPNDEVVFEVCCKPLMIGRTTELCVFDFGSFMIARNFSVTGRAEEEEGLVIDTTRGRPNFKKQIGEQDISRIIADRERKRIRGSQIVRAPFFSQKRLPLNKVPKDLYQIMKEQDEKKLQMMYPHSLELLKFDNYKEKFQVSLWFEEIENDLRRRQYDLHSVRLQRCNSTVTPCHYKFQAPGIQDFQPPVNIQDTIDAFDTGCESNAKFQGTITKIYDTEVTCVFGEAFDQQYAGFPMSIQFNLGRTNYKRCHHAVQTAVDFLGQRFLFPEDNISIQTPRILIHEDNEPAKYHKSKEELKVVSSSKSVTNGVSKQAPTSTSLSNGVSREAPSATSVFRKHKSTGMFQSNPSTSQSSEAVIGRRVQSVRSHFISDTQSTPSCNTARLEWFNTNLNEEQKDAVRRILRGQARPLPYIIYGPPGTGKTVTLVEAIMQVNKLDQNSRILVCGPSNASADVIAEYLANSNLYHPGDFVRLNGFLRDGQTMMESIAPYCTNGEDLNNVAMHRLIICTCMTAGQFFSLDLSIGHFTHVFIDEAGYCTEPEAMVPTILLALPKGGQLILAGDPNQLGPVLMSDVSQNIGLNKSLLERLMTRKLYSRDTERFPVEKYNPLVVTKLVKNYRAHPTLLKLPSKLFYDDDLESRASYQEAHALCQDPNLQNVLVTEGVPLIVHGVQGQCTRERDSPSWCNKAEAIQVVHYVGLLLGKCGLSNDDIGIITPYRKQVEKIRLALQLNLALNDDAIPKVASVEEFQGGERKVIIISTVRSEKEERIDNQIERLGFLYQPKRFNVVITRAKALLIVVGNPHVLSKNHNWLQLLRYALELNAYKGCNIPIHMNKTIRSLVEKKEDRSSSDEAVGGRNGVGGVVANGFDRHDEDDIPVVGYTVASKENYDESIEF